MIAINLIDLDENPAAEIIKNIEKIEHVLSVRLVNNFFYIQIQCFKLSDCYQFAFV